jgi:hypothetical protein
MNGDHHQPPPGNPLPRGAPGYSSLRLRLREEYPADHINCIKSTRVHENGGRPDIGTSVPFRSVGGTSAEDLADARVVA